MDQDLVEAARAARRHAYAPYSNYAVGAAVETDDGRVFSGCNVENASYGLTICAERSAVFAAVAAGARRIRRVAITASGAAVPYPCGACRQVLAEFADAGADVLIVRDAGEESFERIALGDLLPKAFGFGGVPPGAARNTK
jgi:cytidine deaminase